MTKSLQDLAWSRLQKEFKEEVKFEYYRVATKAQKDGYDLGFLHAHEGMFGLHNLTSDAEGEEMLIVSRKKVQEKWQRAYEQEAKYSESEQNPTTREELYYNRGILSILDILFGSKCLPDNVDSLGGNVDSLEPRFKAGDVAVISSEFKHPLLEQGGAIVTILSYHPNGDFYSCAIAPNVGIDVDAKYLEPYTEPKENIAESRKTSQNCDKEFDNILKDGFSKERRLNIAAMAMQGIMANPSPQMVEMDVHKVANLAVLVADALLVEVEKKGGQDA